MADIGVRQHVKSQTSSEDTDCTTISFQDYPTDSSVKYTSYRKCTLKPNINNDPPYYWYADKCFQRYWQHYVQVMQWYQKHIFAYSSLTRCPRYRDSGQTVPRSDGLPSSPWYSLYNPNSRRSSSQHSQNKKREKGKNDKKRGRSRKRRKKNAVDDQYHMEISEDMIDFFKHSQRHRAERDALKEVDNNIINKDHHVDIEKVKSTQKPLTVEAPKERPGSRRTAEMKQLYGQGAAMIHGMETALQMTFDRNLDVNQPKLWPNMPLKIVFS